MASYPEIASLISERVPDMVALRRELHAHPELAYEERETAARVRKRLASLDGIRVREGVCGTGLVAVLGAEKTGPCVALRADMDALPMEEETDLPYRSTVPGKMHACGHDGHTAALLGAAEVLHAVRDTLGHPVVFIFQPAEEGGAGAARMIADGVFDDPGPAAIFGLHNMPLATMRFGQIAWRPGPLMAAGGVFDIRIRGRGGHAAIPQLSTDPVAVAGHVITALQHVVSRQADPLTPSVVSITKIQGGSTYNVIPSEAQLKGTFRCLDQIEFEAMRERISGIVQRIAEAFGAEAEVRFAPDPYPVLVNDERACGVLDSVCRATDRESDRVAPCPPMMASEDFAFYTHEIPGAFFFVGTRPPDQESIPMCHHPAFDFNDDALPLCIAMHCEIARRFPELWNAD